jgi:hypothetical protein
MVFAIRLIWPPFEYIFASSVLLNFIPTVVETPITLTMPEPVAETLAPVSSSKPELPLPVADSVPLIVIVPLLVVIHELNVYTPRAPLTPLNAVPVRLTFPVPNAEILAPDPIKTPIEVTPLPHEVPLNVSEPELVVTVTPCAKIPKALEAPFLLTPVIVTLPVPVAEMLAEFVRKTPLESVPVPHEVPVTVREPELVVTVAPSTRIPCASFVPFAALPVIVTLPVSVAEMLADEARKTPLEYVPVPLEVPLTVREPELVVTVAPNAFIP